MTMVATTRSTPTATWGWRILAALTALMIVNAAGLYVAVPTPETFEADTGVAFGEVQAAFPAVVEVMATRGRTIGLLLGGLGALALAVTIAGMRTGESWARTCMWVFVAALAAVGTNALVGGRADIGGFYLVWAVLAGIGIVLAGRGART